MTNLTKRRALSYLFLTALITMLLAATLPHLELQKGIPLPGSANTGGNAPAVEEAPLIAVNISTFAKMVLALLVIMMLVYLLMKMHLGPDWKDIARAFLTMVVVSVVITGILFIFANGRVSPVPLEIEALPTEVKQVGPDLAPVPPALLWLVWIGLAGIILLLVIALVRQRSSARRADPLVLEAEQAVQALKAGQDLRSVIIHCYRQMSLILQAEQGLTRMEAMTAREFETLLETRGVPPPPVRQLTRLFEMARYAAQISEPGAEQQAFDSLNAIIQFSQKKEGGGLK